MKEEIIQETTKGGHRTYKVGNKTLPSVTTICACYPKGDGFYRWLANIGWDEAQNIKEQAGVIGRNVHSRIEEFIKTEDMDFENITLEEIDMLKNFIEWWYDLKNKKVIASEIAVVNKKVGYAGTVDLIMEIDGEKWVIDIKTPKNIWPSHEIQLAAYKHCGHEDAKIGIIQLSGDEYKFIELEDKFDLFLAVKTIFDNEK